MIAPDAGPVTSAAVLELRHPGAVDPSCTGSKAAALATAQAAGLRVLPGFVLTTAFHRAYLEAGRQLPGDRPEPLQELWAGLSDHGARPLVVRSSSTVEDVGASSMAGRFRSVLAVRGWEPFLEAVTEVLGSADSVAGGSPPAPMAVLVQPFMTATRGGVMFGIDPVTGDDRRLVVEAVTGGPDALVSGRVSAQRYVLGRRGRPISIDNRPHHVLSWSDHGRRLLADDELRALARLAAQAHRCFGGWQDVEWAFDASGALVLLQSRPVTATGTLVDAVGPVLGPGPLAETFPDPLGPLEGDLWIPPLREGVVDALREARAVRAATLRRSPVVTTVHRRVAADLELFGYVTHRSRLGRLDPRPGLHRLAAAWQIGRLRAVLPARAAQLVSEVDTRLAAVRLDQLDTEALVDLLAEAVQLLRRLHREEVLAGTVLRTGSVRTAASVALAVLAADPDRSDEDRLIHRHPVLLALSPPGIGVPVALPPAPAPAAPQPQRPVIETAEAAEAELPIRERLRLRVRWVQELSARTAGELGRRLVARGVLEHAADIALLERRTLKSVVAEGVPVSRHEARAELIAAVFTPPLPAQFRLSRFGEVVAVARPGARPTGGVGAGGGRGSGSVVHGSVQRPPAPGEVLVVRELQPGLAAWLPGLAGLIAETGGTLSHLAILAREYGVPTVVAVHDALTRFPEGTAVVVDGSTGDVVTLDRKEKP